jgi:fructose-1,6-bisphosphatase/inositol monophosphatase family enzyme
VSGTTCWAVRGGGCFVDGPEGPRRVHTGGAEPTIFYDPRTPAAWRDALSRRFGHIELSRCSAVDAPAPATGRARGGISAGHADRRQAIGLFLTLEAGGAVRIGGQRWQGEDPELAVGDGPSIVAEDDALADAILAAVASAGGGVGQSIP